MTFKTITQADAVIEAFKALGGDRSISVIENQVIRKYGARMVDYGTCMADMVHTELTSNRSSNVPIEKKKSYDVLIVVFTL